MLKHFDEIKNFLPHREPFLFIEEIIEVELGKSIHCILKNSPDDDFYKGHFPNNPIFPGVLLLKHLHKHQEFWVLKQWIRHRKRDQFMFLQE